MAYCTVQEAWGPDFGATNNNVGWLSAAPPPIENKRKESFSDYSSLSHMYEDHHGHYGQVSPTNVKDHPGVGYHNPETRKLYKKLGESNTPNGVPYAYTSGSDYYDGSKMYPLDGLGTNRNEPHPLEHPYDYREESQLCDKDQRPVSYCSNAFKHLIDCSVCRKRIIKEIEAVRTSSEDTTSKNETDIDFTELALFLAMGIFLIFLFDAIVKFIKRY